MWDEESLHSRAAAIVLGPMASRGSMPERDAGTPRLRVRGHARASSVAREVGCGEPRAVPMGERGALDATGRGIEAEGIVHRERSECRRARAGVWIVRPWHSSV